MEKVSQEIRIEQGFRVFTLRSKAVELSVVPELGARVVSLRNLRTEREWLWHPEGGLKLFRNKLGDDFSHGPLAGIDECLPTVAPCVHQGRCRPDHGEIWSASWTINPQAWDSARLTTSLKLPVSPFQFERSVELIGNGIRMSYRLTNLSSNEEPFVWALHPLLRVKEGDRLELPASTCAQFNGQPWIHALDSSIPDGGCAKAFAHPLKEGRAAVYNAKTGDRLTFEWDIAQNNTLGLWLTRGGWHGHHHLAIEPTNASADTLADAVNQGHCGTAPAGGSVTWMLQLRLA